MYYKTISHLTSNCEALQLVDHASCSFQQCNGSLALPTNITMADAVRK